MSSEALLLVATAAGIGALHAIIGPDHYLPFITLGRARRWSLSRTVGVTLASGIGHVAGSLLLGALGASLGWALGGLERIESWRGDLAGWLLLGFGLAYLAWGLRQAYRGRRHSHLHAHADGTTHRHDHTHDAAHGHLHDPPADAPRTLLKGVTAWTVFLIFVVGPCEALIPLLAYSAAMGSASVVVAVSGAFALATLTTMVAAVLIGMAGLELLPIARLERWSHAAAGGVVAACGAAIQFGL